VTIVFLTNLSYYELYMLHKKYINKIIQSLFIHHSVYGISCCPFADHVFLKLPTPHKRLRRPDLATDKRVMIK